VKRASYMALTNRHTHRETRYHGAPHLRCLEGLASSVASRGYEGRAIELVCPAQTREKGI
jgi:hypothetical protein